MRFVCLIYHFYLVSMAPSTQLLTCILQRMFKKLLKQLEFVELELFLNLELQVCFTVIVKITYVPEKYSLFIFSYSYFLLFVISYAGHTKSWEHGQPGILAQCEDEYGQPTDVYGPMVWKILYHFLDYLSI